MLTSYPFQKKEVGSGRVLERCNGDNKQNRGQGTVRRGHAEGRDASFRQA